MVDKNNVIPRITKLDKVILDLGCGPLKRQKDWIGIDILDFDNVDIVGDIYEVIRAFPDNSVDEVHSYHFFEHIPDVPGLLIELSRVLKQTGSIEVVVPHFSNAYYYSDYTHKSFFGLYSFSYMVKDELLRRKVPNYQLHTGLQLKSVFLRFKSPLLLTGKIRMIWQFFFNSSTLFKEWYEDSWSRNFPCYELQFILIKL
jgi:SAM-dependent methyltransferase